MAPLIALEFTPGNGEIDHTILKTDERLIEVKTIEVERHHTDAEGCAIDL